MFQFGPEITKGPFPFRLRKVNSRHPHRTSPVIYIAPSPTLFYPHSYTLFSPPPLRLSTSPTLRPAAHWQ